MKKKLAAKLRSRQEEWQVTIKIYQVAIANWRTLPSIVEIYSFGSTIDCLDRDWNWDPPVTSKRTLSCHSCVSDRFRIVTLTGAEEDSKRPRTRPRSLSGATSQPGLPPKASRPRGRHRTAIATASALGLEEAVPPAPGSSDRVRSYTRHRAAIAETRGLWDETEPIGRGGAVEESPSLRRVTSVHSVPSPDKEKSCTGRPKRHQRSLERNIDKSWFAWPCDAEIVIERIERGARLSKYYIYIYYIDIYTRQFLRVLNGDPKSC